jgi:benzodiazapine receptor
LQAAAPISNANECEVSSAQGRNEDRALAVTDGTPSETRAVLLRRGALRGSDLRWALVAAASVLIASVAGQLASASAVEGWYRTIAKPWFTPPNWVFPVAWTLLFTIMGTAFWRILRHPSGTPSRRTAIALFVVQLAFNSGWSAVFFGAQSPKYGLVVIAPLWALILATILVFRGMDRLAARMLVPYLVWLTFAAVLNVAIWTLN